MPNTCGCTLLSEPSPYSVQMLCEGFHTSCTRSCIATRYALFRVNSDFKCRRKYQFFSRAAALATGCKVKITIIGGTYDLRQNKALSDELENIMCSRYGTVDFEWGIAGASTDFVSNLSKIDLLIF